MTQNKIDRLAPLRAQLDRLDGELAELIRTRLSICMQVAEVKMANGIAMMQPERVRHVQESYAARGRQLGLDPGFMRSLASLLVDEACRVEQAIINESQQRKAGGVADEH